MARPITAHAIERTRAGVTRGELQRLDGAVAGTHAELERYRCDGDQEWWIAAESELRNATEHREHLELEAAWTALKASRREMLHALSWSGLVAEAHAARREAEAKLTGWRSSSVVDLLTPDLLGGVDLVCRVQRLERAVGLTITNEAGQEPSLIKRIEEAEQVLGYASNAARDLESRVEEIEKGLGYSLRARVRKAKEILDEDADNVYRKYRFLQKAVFRSFMLISGVLGVLGLFVALEWIPEAVVAEDSPLASWRLLLVVMGLGALGSFMSAAIELRDSDRTLRIPDLRVNNTLMWLRPVVGAAGAIIVIVVLQSGLDGTITVGSTGLLPLAIAAGFTERLATRAVTSAEKAVGR